MVNVSDFRKIQGFNSYSDDQLSELAEITEKIYYGANEIIYRRGDPANYLFVIALGSVSLKHYEAGDKVGIAFENRKKGEMFGVAVLMEPPVYSLTAVAIEESELLAVDAKALLALCEKRSDIGYRLMREVAKVYLERYRQVKVQLYQMIQAPYFVTDLPK